MKILFLAHRLPYPPNKGDKIRSFNILKHLSQKYEIFLACPVDKKSDIQYIKELQPYCKAIDWVLINPGFRRLFSIKSLLTNEPLSVNCFYSSKLQAKINRLLRNENFDVIFAFSSQMAKYLKAVTNTKRIMDFVDVDSRKWQQYASFQKNLLSRWLYNFESKRLAIYEKQIAQAYDVSILVSDTEANIFRSTIYDGGKITAIHNGVDYSFFNPTRLEENTKRASDSPIILFTGAMDYYPNVDAVSWFIKDIFPLIKQKLPTVKFCIAGKNPGKPLKKLHNGDDIVVTGYVNDIREYFSKASVFVAPFRIACGIQNKILEAFSMGLPVVATTIGAEGLKETDCPVVVKDRPEDFAEQVMSFLSTPGDHLKESDIYREWIIKNYDWQRNLCCLDRITGR